MAKTCPENSGEIQASRNCGRWQKGESGNPRGKQPGTRHKATRAALALLEGDLEAVTQALLAKARAGEPWAIRLVISKLIPDAKDAPVSFGLPRAGAAGLRQVLEGVLRGVAAGALTPAEAADVARVVETLGLAREVETLEALLLEGKR